MVQPWVSKNLEFFFDTKKTKKTQPCKKTQADFSVPEDGIEGLTSNFA